MTTEIKDYLGYEQNRNKQHAALYERMLRRAFPGRQIAVLVGHHITFEFDSAIETENEIPSADSLIFDHDIMHRIFGVRYLDIMMRLSVEPCPQRDVDLATYLDHLEIGYDKVSLAPLEARPNPLW